MKKDPQILLKHILENLELIEGFTKDLSREEFHKSAKTQYAVLRGLEIIGEAARNLPEDFKARHGDIPWEDIAGMRNRIIHEYFGVDLEVVWGTIRRDIPNLKRKVEGILKG